MAKKLLTVHALTHDEATRRNAPMAELEAFVPADVKALTRWSGAGTAPCSCSIGPTRLFGCSAAGRRSATDRLPTRLIKAIPATEVAMLIRGRRQVDPARAAVRIADSDAPVLTMHGAMGPKFQAVAVMAADKDIVLDSDRLSGVGHVVYVEAVQDIERHLLCVALTRTRNRVMLSSGAPKSKSKNGSP